MKLTKEKLVVIVSAAAAVAFLGIWLIFFRPLADKLKSLHLEYRGLEISLARARDAAGSLKSKGFKKELVSEAEVSLAIEELTKEGKAKGINYISLTPKQIERRQGPYKMLPVDLELEASYAVLSDFLGKLDELKRSLVCIRKLNIIPNKANPKISTTRLSLDMYILE